jgi:hypothetical protein
MHFKPGKTRVSRSTANHIVLGSHIHIHYTIRIITSSEIEASVCMYNLASERKSLMRFLASFFPLEEIILVPIDMPKSIFEFCRIFKELFVFGGVTENDSSLSLTAHRGVKNLA